MSVIKTLHRQAMEETDIALAAQQKGEIAEALVHFREAYQLESTAALRLVNDLESEPTRSVLLRSAASLALDCDLIREAEQLVCIALSGNPPLDIAEELRDLLEQIHFQRHLSLKGITLLGEEFQMSIEGEAVGLGIAPTAAFLDRVDKTETLLYRTAERKSQRPYRDRGRRDKALEENLKLYISVPRAASFAVTFRVGQGEQLSLPGMSLGEEIVDELLDCLELFTRGDEAQIRERIPEEAYYRNFMGLARGIAPDGHQVRLVGFTAHRHGQEKRVALNSTMDGLVQRASSESASIVEPGTASPSSTMVTITGVLKLADSRTTDKDEIRIIDAGNVSHTIVVPPGMMSDIVKPLWDTNVVVVGTRRRRSKKIELQDIQPSVPNDHE